MISQVSVLVVRLLSLTPGGSLKLLARERVHFCSRDFSDPLPELTLLTITPLSHRGRGVPGPGEGSQ